ncbi:DUF294 nucleotidyltransferase-like domain-containing protein [Bacillus sp. PS06]|uniref:DUF294 nucleotidyltransferase-like domain-containing protein n=1 Tax=Bacillus sp. PS06 TaxID=2764176 RepID=UPI00177FB5E3|nr:DUF294 nucleotidyltransferase-like domain-containing protein [Bacillus sp. PS06]MBD8071513.1 hypothetical protein [Bacillus sp. PS06]
MTTNLSLLRKWREETIATVGSDYQKLNTFHDELIRKAFLIAIEKVKSVQGDPPAHFAFFLMGSSGRGEQSVWSDQDHGMIFDGSEKCNSYFLALGEEVSTIMSELGYAYCDGKVMSSNPLWCKSKQQWQKQIEDWLDEQSWESIRHFTTFFDSRVLIGDQQLLLELKEYVFLRLERDHGLYQRFVENVSHLKKGIGLFGQLLTTDHGEEAGTINMKEKVFFLYVNSLRILALKEGLTVASTISRFNNLPDSYETIKGYKKDFVDLLQFRLAFQKDSKSYENVHLLKISRLTKQEKQELKRIMKNGYKLFADTRAIIEKGVQNGD